MFLEHISNGFILKQLQKTASIKRLPLNIYALEILNRYLNDDAPIPVISAQKANEYIKDDSEIIAEKQKKNEGFNKLIIKKKVIGRKEIEKSIPFHQAITFHIARKTFITNSIMLYHLEI